MMVMICAKNRPHSSHQWLGSSLKASAQRPSFSRSSDASLWSLSAAISTCTDTADANHQANGKSIAAVQRKLNCFTSIAASHQDHHQTWWRKWDKLHQSIWNRENRDSEKKNSLPSNPGALPRSFFGLPPKKKLTLGGDFFSQASSRLEALNMVFSITRLLQSNNPGWYAPWN